MVLVLVLLLLLLLVWCRLHAALALRTAQLPITPACMRRVLCVLCATRCCGAPAIATEVVWVGLQLAGPRTLRPASTAGADRQLPRTQKTTSLLTHVRPRRRDDEAWQVKKSCCGCHGAPHYLPIITHT
jgi:hypothetical protein